MVLSKKWLISQCNHGKKIEKRINLILISNYWISERLVCYFRRTDKTLHYMELIIQNQNIVYKTALGTT